MTSITHLDTQQRSRYEVLRICCDFVALHICMILAIASSIGVEAFLLHSGPAHGTVADVYMSYYAMYYLTHFLPLSLLFPVIFLSHGFYTASRRYSRHKVIVAAQGTVLACLVFLLASALLSQGNPRPRRAELFFAVLVMAAIPAIRAIKTSFLLRFRILPRAEMESRTDPGERVLVVGWAGYIGSILVRRLLEMGKTVRVLDSLLYGDDPIAAIKGHPRLELIVGDCRNIQHVVSAVQNVTGIIDLAAIVGDPACEEDRGAALEINYAATRMMIEVAKGHGVRQFIFASSCSVYGASERITDENGELNPISLYAQTKIDSERALLEAGSESFSPVVLRFATVFGHSHRPRFDLVVNLLTAKAIQESRVVIYNGQQWRPFIHVRDVCEAIIKALESPTAVTAGEVFNVGDSRLNYTLSQVADKIRLRFPNTQVDHVENSDRRDYRVSFAKVKARLGFECSIDLDQGIAELHQAFESGEIRDYTDARYHNQRFLQRSGLFRPPHEVDSDIMAAFAQTKTKVQAAAAH